MLRFLLAHTRGILRLIVGLAVLAALVLGLFLPPLVRVVSSSAADKLLLAMLGVWSRCTLLVMGVKVVSNGPSPVAPYLLACNHLSYLDVMILWSQVDGFFLGKSELAKWPVMGPLIRAAGTVFINRTQRRGVVEAIKGVTDKVNTGSGVIFFPEGTSSSGGEVRQFKSNMFQVAAQSELPVHIAVLRYTTSSKYNHAETDMAWWGEMTFPSHFYKLLTFDNKVAQLKFLEEAVAHADRIEMARHAEQLAVTAFEPMHQFDEIERGNDVSFLS